MRVALHPCFILHQRPYRESSLLLDVFSREHGRIGLVGKGGRRSKKNAQALYQSYRNLNISWSGRGALGTLTEIEAEGVGFDLQGEVMIAAFYLNELLLRLLHQHESHPELFDAYLISLTRLAHGESVLITLRYFEKQLLDALGYGLVLDHEVESGEPIDSGKDYFYMINRGPCSRKPEDSAYVKIAGSTLLDLHNEIFDEHSRLDEVKQLMRLTLNNYLDGKPLASRELYQAYIAQKS